MGRDARKAFENPCFKCRKEAAKHDERLFSREGAAELLGVSVSSLAEYETGITKVIPVDKIVLMAELYGAPELKLWYCSEECPIGKSAAMLPSYNVSSVERTTLGLLKMLRKEKVASVTDMLIDIAADGTVTKEERVYLAEIMGYLDALIMHAGQLRLLGSRLMNEGATDG